MDSQFQGHQVKISAVIWAKDEIDVLPRTLGALLRSGVATVSVLDDDSSDGTSLAIDVLCAALPNVYRIPKTTNDLTASLAMDGPIFGPILARDQPDWLLASDPDEFWVPLSGDLRDTRALETHDIVVVDRFNAALRKGEPDLAQLETDHAIRDLPVIVEQVTLSRKRMELEPGHRWVTHAIAPKLMVRPDRLARFDLGLHAAVGKEGGQLKRTVGQDVLVAHLPFTTFERFERKVNNARRVFERYDREHSGERAWHWRRWIGIQDAGGLRREYERQFFSAAELATRIESGAVAPAGQILARRNVEA